MRYALLSVLVIGIGFAFIKYQRTGTDSESMPLSFFESSQNGYAVQQDESKPSIARSFLAKSEEEVTSPEINLNSLREVLDIDRKVLKSQRELEAYHEALQDHVRIHEARVVLTEVREPTNEQAFLENQKQRMDAALFLTRAAEWKQNPAAPEIRSVIRSLVLDDAVQRAKDPKLKKSLLADRIELFANLKSVDRAAGNQIQQSARTESSKKVIQFANNFYRLDGTKK